MKRLVLLLSVALVLVTAHDVSMWVHWRVSTTGTVHWLSPSEVMDLERRVAKYGDDEAAMRLYWYYAASRKDYRLSHIWLEKAASLGNAGAKKLIKSLSGENDRSEADASGDGNRTIENIQKVDGSR
jgi:hypothetical protein